MDAISGDLHLALLKYLSFVDAIRLSCVCKSVRGKTWRREEWWLALWTNGAVASHLGMDRGTLNSCFGFRQGISGVSKQHVKAVVKRPPQFSLVLKYNPAVRRDDALACIQNATGDHGWGGLSSLWTALQIGHPLFNPAPENERKGTLTEGSWKAIRDAQIRFQSCAHERGLDLVTTIEAIPYVLLLDEENDADGGGCRLA